MAYQLVDADHHLYEPRDCFTGYIDPQYRDRAVRAQMLDGREAIFAGDREVTYMAVNMYEKVGRPGSLKDLLHGLKAGGPDGLGSYQWDTIKPVYRDRDVRLAYMDEQEIEKILVFPSIGVVVEAYFEDTKELYANLHAYNRYLDEQWGFAYKDRIFGVPMMSLKDLDLCIAELDWAIARGARVVSLRPGPAYGRSFGDPYFDPFWSRCNEAGVSIGLHLADSGYNARCSTDWGWAPNPSNFEMSAWQWMNCDGDRPIMETLAAMVYDNIFGRFPNVKAVSVENGAEWFPYFLRRLNKMRGMARSGPWIGGPLPERPTEIVKRHVLVTPYPEDDIGKIAEQVGTESLVFGSDWPHAEGLVQPSDYRATVAELTPQAQQLILRDNGLRILGQV